MKQRAKDTLSAEEKKYIDRAIEKAHQKRMRMKKKMEMMDDDEEE